MGRVRSRAREAPRPSCSVVLARVRFLSEPRLILSAMSSLLTAQDVAAMLGVPASWVYAQTRSGAIPTVRLGRYYRYRPQAVEAWIASREKG